MNSGVRTALVSLEPLLTDSGPCTFTVAAFRLKLQNKIAFIAMSKKFLKATPSGNFNKTYEKDCHSSCEKCYSWGFHANKVSKPKPHIWCQTALKIWSCTSFKIPFFLFSFFLRIFICRSQFIWDNAVYNNTEVSVKTYLIHWLMHPMAHHFTCIYEERKIYLLIVINMHYL